MRELLAHKAALAKGSFAVYNRQAMEAGRISELLQPFLQSPTTVAPPYPSLSRAGSTPEESAVLDQSQLESISNHLDLLLLWNARVNLTAVRRPEDIITRHFGESLFLAQYLFPAQRVQEQHIIDFGSGAGFPGLPIKIWAPDIQLTLIESNQKKATFLREVIRKLGLADVEVFSGRAEECQHQADVVTLRAVEKFDQALPVALRLVRTGGQLAMLIGERQVERVRQSVPAFNWNDPVEVPLSSNRVLLIGTSPHDP